MTRGRKALPPEDRAKTKNITVDADLVQALNDAADALAIEFGFRPTLSQTLRNLISKVKRKEDDNGN